MQVKHSEDDLALTLHLVVRYGCIAMACLTNNCALILVNK